MSKLREKANKYLRDNPGAQVYGVTNDPNAFLFLRKQDAKNHAVTLGETEVESFGTPTSIIKPNDSQTISGNQLDERELAERNAEAEKKAEAHAKAKAEADKKVEAEAQDADAKAKEEVETKVETEAEKPAPKKTKKTTTKK